MRNLIVFLLLVVTATSYAQINPMHAEINRALVRDGITAEAFVIGIGTAPKDHPDAHELAMENAIASVYTQVADSVRAIILANADAAFQDNVAAHYSTVAQMPVVAVELPGIVEVTLPFGRSTDDKNAYFVAAFDRKEIINLYAKKAKKLREAINKTLADDNIGNPTSTAAQYLDTYRRYEELKEAELIMVGAEYNPHPKEAFKKLYEYQKSEGSQQETINYLDTYFQNTVPVMLNSTASLAHLIVTQLEMQGANSPPRDRVQLDMFTYGITGAPTSVSEIFVNAIEREMTKKWDTILKTRLISNPEYPYSAIHSLGFGRDVNSRLTGTYWERGNKVTIRATLRDVNTGEFQAVGIVRFNKNALENIRSDRYRPHDYEAIMDRLVVEAKEKIGQNYRNAAYILPTPGPEQSDVTTTVAKTDRGAPQGKETTTPVIEGVTTPVIHNAGFKVELNTNKGSGAVPFAIGEKAQFFVNVNQAAYIRLLFEQDGKWSQLAEDQYVKPEQATRWLEIPGDFVFAEPEGLGQLVVLAKTTAFEPITDFYYQDGYRYIGKPSSPSGTLTAEARYKETLETEFVLKGPINRNFKKDIEQADILLKGPVNRSFEKDNPINPVSMDDSVARASIYLITTKPTR